MHVYIPLIYIMLWKMLVPLWGISSEKHGKFLYYIFLHKLVSLRLPEDYLFFGEHMYYDSCKFYHIFLLECSWTGCCTLKEFCETKNLRSVGLDDCNWVDTLYLIKWLILRKESAVSPNPKMWLLKTWRVIPKAEISSWTTHPVTHGIWDSQVLNLPCFAGE